MIVLAILAYLQNQSLLDRISVLEARELVLNDIIGDYERSTLKGKNKVVEDGGVLTQVVERKVESDSDSEFAVIERNVECSSPDESALLASDGDAVTDSEIQVNDYSKHQVNDYSEHQVNDFKQIPKELLPPEEDVIFHQTQEYKEMLAK